VIDAYTPHLGARKSGMKYGFVTFNNKEEGEKAILSTHIGSILGVTWCVCVGLNFKKDPLRGIPRVLLLKLVPQSGRGFLKHRYVGTTLALRL